MHPSYSTFSFLLNITGHSGQHPAKKIRVKLLLLIMKIYVDTNVFLSYWFSDFGKLDDFQEYRTKELIKRTIDCEFIFVISDLTLEEMSTVSNLGIKEIEKSWLKPLKDAGKLQTVIIDSKDMARAKELIKTKQVGHKKDAIHAAIVENNGLTLVTWNIKDFIGLPTVKVLTPKEL
jgi:predicted nucleic acid-binding protein